MAIHKTGWNKIIGGDLNLNIQDLQFLKYKCLIEANVITAVYETTEL